MTTETTEDGKPICPVCGTVGWFDTIDVSLSSDPPIVNYRTVDGYAHCPNEDDDRHINWWRECRSVSWAAAQAI